MTPAAYEHQQVIVSLIERQSAVQRQRAAAEQFGFGPAMAAADDELTKIDALISALTPAERHSPELDLELLDGDAVAHLEQAIADLER